MPPYARACLTLAGRAEAFCRGWTVPTAEPLTRQQYAAILSDLISYPVKLKALSALMVRLASPFSRLAREFVEEIHEVTEPWIVDGSDYSRTFGDLKVMPHREAFERTLDSVTMRHLTTVQLS